MAASEEGEITINVLFFASARELAGTHKAEITLSGANSTTQGLREALAQRFPRLAGTVETITLALNKEYLEKDTELSHNDEVALIPAISGG